MSMTDRKRVIVVGHINHDRIWRLTEPLRAGGRIAWSSRETRLGGGGYFTARRLLDDRPWGAEVLPLSGSVELGPLLDLAELALDIVQTGRTLAENGLVELETVAEVAPCLVVNRSAYQRHRVELRRLAARLEEVGAAA